MKKQQTNKVTRHKLTNQEGFTMSFPEKVTFTNPYIYLGEDGVIPYSMIQSAKGLKYHTKELNIVVTLPDNFFPDESDHAFKEEMTLKAAEIVLLGEMKGEMELQYDEMIV